MQKRIMVLGGGVLAAFVLAVAGCQPPGTTKDSEGKKEEAKVEKKVKHDGWWCNEHGIPEHECSMCSAAVAKEFKAKGDWCDKHDRAKSQCFICDPSLKEKFAERYRAKYGKEPPPTEDEEDNKEPAKKDRDKSAEKKDGK